MRLGPSPRMALVTRSALLPNASATCLLYFAVRTASFKPFNANPRTPMPGTTAAQQRARINGQQRGPPAIDAGDTGAFYNQSHLLRPRARYRGIATQLPRSLGCPAHGRLQRDPELVDHCLPSKALVIFYLQRRRSRSPLLDFDRFLREGFLVSHLAGQRRFFAHPPRSPGSRLPNS